MINVEKWPGSSVVCQPLGALDLEAASELRHRITAILRPELDLVLDLSHVDYIDAFGASALVGSLRRVRAMGGSPRVCHVNPRIRWVLDIIGIDRFLTGDPEGNVGRPRETPRFRDTSSVGSRRILSNLQSYYPCP